MSSSQPSSLVSIFRVLLVFSVFAFLGGCGGGNTNDVGEINAPTATLSAFSFEGFDINFMPERTGLYELEVPSNVDSVTFTATSSSAQSIDYRLVALDVPTLTDQPVTSGAPLTIAIQEGTNLLTVNLASSGSASLVTYNFSITRAVGSASLDELSIFDLRLSDDARATLSPEFAPEVLSYTAAVDPASCAAQIQLRANSNRNTVRLNGDTVTTGVSPAVPLIVGSNEAIIDVTSEDGSAVTSYNVNLTREAPSQEQLDASSRLIDLTVSDVALDFSCLQTSYTADVSIENSEPTLTVSPEFQGASITLFEADAEGNLSEEQTLTAGSPSGLTLEAGDNRYVVRVTPADSSVVARDYVVNLRLLDVNVVFVRTSEQLQQALTNAQPNDEIRVAEGIYQGLAPEADGGSAVESAHFYSSASGTAEQPITIVGQSSTQGATLMGVSTSALSVLQLDGDYWRIANIAFSGAREGVVLNGASNIDVTGASFSGLGATGLAIQNGSHNNFVGNSEFFSIGEALAGEALADADALVVGSDSMLWNAEAGGTGDLEPLNTGNLIRNNIFGASLRAQSIEVNEGAQETIIEFNRFATGGLSDATEAGTVLRIQGNDTIVRFNQFIHTDDANATSAIALAPASIEALEQDWGMRSQIYKNVLSFNGQDLTFVSADDERVAQAADNIRDDGLNTEYLGAMIDSTAFESPAFQIQWEQDPSMCIALGEDATEFVPLLEACSDAVDQQWQFTLDAQGFVQIVNNAQPDLFLRPQLGFASTQPEVTLLSTAGTTDAFLQRWMPVLVSKSISFSNRQDNRYFISVLAPLEGEENTLIVAGAGQSPTSLLFRLVTLD